MKIVVTGGHFSPAYSIIQKIRNGNEILVVGRKHAFEEDKSETFEYKVCKKLDIPFKSIKTGRLSRRLSLNTFKSLAKFPIGIYKSTKILKDFKPDVVVTFGGYIGLPVAIAAFLLKIPVVLHEQTQKAGLSSKLISKFSTVILVSFESSREFFKGKNVVLTGNPLRSEFFDKNKNSLGIQNPSIYVTGGSTGSHFINDIVSKILPNLLSDYQVFHQTGDSKEFNDYDNLKKINHKNYNVAKFYNPSEVFELLKSVDLVISRSGINTVCEIIATGAVSLLVPLPIGQLNEQKDNAIFVKQLGIGDFMLQVDITPEKLLERIDDMIRNKQSFKKNFVSSRKFIVFDSTDKIVEQIYLHGRGGKKENNEKTAH